MTRTELLAAIARNTGKNATLDSTTQTRLISHLHEGERMLLTMPGAHRLRESWVSFTSVADQPEYYVSNTHKIHRIYDPTNRRVLAEIDAAQYKALQPDYADTTGLPEAWVWLGMSPQLAWISNPSALFVDSTSGSDTNTATVVGQRSGRLPHTSTVTMTGTTAVNMDATVSDWIWVNKFYLSAAAVGTVTLVEDAEGGTIISRILPGQTGPETTWHIAFWPTPDDAYTYRIDIEHGFRPMAAATDEPLVPEEFHDLLVDFATIREYEHMRDDRLQWANQRYRERLRYYRYWLAEGGTGVGQGPFEPPSRISGWAPSGV
jgi:hypothetical protein